jgi:hypothetical protein
MHVCLNAANIGVEHIHLVDSPLLFDTESHTNLIDNFEIFLFVKAGNITSVKYVVDIF